MAARSFYCGADVRTAEHRRLREAEARVADWKLLGPYVAERAWGTVREDYSVDGAAWQSSTHEQSRARAYRWSEDGIAGFCTRKQEVVLSLALWNGVDPILKERLWGLGGMEGNHGENVMELYAYLDSTPTHSWATYAYVYPFNFPYDRVVRENAARSRADPELSLWEAVGEEAWAAGEFWDVTVSYAKAGPGELLCRIRATNCSEAHAELHLLPHLAFRNTWSWGYDERRPWVQEAAGGAGGDDDAPDGRTASAAAYERHLGHMRYSVTVPECSDGHLLQPPELLLTHNDTNFQRVYGAEAPNMPPGSTCKKDAIHTHVCGDNAFGPPGSVATVLPPGSRGTKAAVWTAQEVPPGGSAEVWVRFTIDGEWPAGEGESADGVRVAAGAPGTAALPPAALPPPPLADMLGRCESTGELLAAADEAVAAAASANPAWATSAAVAGLSALRAAAAASKAGLGSATPGSESSGATPAALLGLGLSAPGSPALTGAAGGPVSALPAPTGGGRGVLVGDGAEQLMARLTQLSRGAGAVTPGGNAEAPAAASGGAVQPGDSLLASPPRLHLAQRGGGEQTLGPPGRSGGRDGGWDSELRPPPSFGSAAGVGTGGSASPSHAFFVGSTGSGAGGAGGASVRSGFTAGGDAPVPPAGLAASSARMYSSPAKDSRADGGLGGGIDMRFHAQTHLHLAGLLAAASQQEQPTHPSAPTLGGALVTAQQWSYPPGAAGAGEVEPRPLGAPGMTRVLSYYSDGHHGDFYSDGAASSSVALLEHGGLLLGGGGGTAAAPPSPGGMRAAMPLAMAGRRRSWRGARSAAERQAAARCAMGPYGRLCFDDFLAVLQARSDEADAFYAAVQPASLSDEDRLIQRQAFGGLLWSKMYYHFSVKQWLDGDPAFEPPPTERRCPTARNVHWQHLYANDVISMPDKVRAGRCIRLKALSLPAFLFC